MAERRRLIAFNQEVADPCKRVRHDGPQQRIPGMSNGKSHYQRSQSKQSSNRMHGPIASIAVLMQIEGEEIFVAGKFLFGNGLSFLLGLIAFPWERRVRRILLWPRKKLPLAARR